MAARNQNNTITIKQKADNLWKEWDSKLLPNFQSFFDGKPILLKQFAEVIRRFAIVSPEVIQKHTPAALAPSLLKAAELGLVPDKNECAIVDVGGKPQCWVMTGGARKKIGECIGVKYCTVVAIYENEEIIYNKASNVLPVINMKEGVSFFDKGKVVGAIAFVETDDGRIILEEIGLQDADKYKPKNRDWHYSDKWMAEFLQNTATKKLYRKLPKTYDMPRDIWDDADKAPYPKTTSVINASVVVGDDESPDDTAAATAEPLPDEKLADQPPPDETNTETNKKPLVDGISNS